MTGVDAGVEIEIEVEIDAGGDTTFGMKLGMVEPGKDTFVLEIVAGLAAGLAAALVSTKSSIVIGFQEDRKYLIPF